MNSLHNPKMFHVLPCEMFQFASLLCNVRMIEFRMIYFQGSTNCVPGDKHARNVHAKRFWRAQNHMHVNQSKHF